MAKHRSKKRDAVSEDANDLELPTSIPRKTNGGRWWKRILCIFAIALLLLLLVAPAIICKTPILDRVANSYLAESGLRVSFASATAGWFSPIGLQQVVVRDIEDHVLLEFESVAGTRSLLALIRNQHDLGKFTINKPVVNFVVHDHGSNFEDSFNPWLGGEPSTSSAVRPGVEFEIIDGTFNITEQRSQTTTQLANVNSQGKLPANALEAIKLQVDASVIAANQSGPLNAQFEWQPTANRLGKGKLKLQSKDVPLDFVAPLLPRFAPELFELVGKTTSQLDIAWNDESESPTIQSTGTINVDGLFCEAAWIEEDRLAIDNIRFTSDVTTADGILSVKHFDFVSPLGTLEIEGTSKLPTSSSLSLADLQSLISQVQISGDVDLAALTATLPRTLQMREDTKLRSGRVVLDASAKNIAEGTQLSGVIATSDLSAVRYGRPIDWKKPVRVEFDIVNSKDDLNVRRLICQSTFLSFSGSGRPSEGRLLAQADLRRMQVELEKFIDFDGIKLDGRVHAKAQWQRESVSDLIAGGDLRAEGFRMLVPGMEPWAEEQLDLKFRADGKLIGTQLAGLDQANLTLVSGPDRLESTLTHPVSPVVANTTWPLSISLRGTLSTWHRRLAPFVPVKELRLAGGIELSATAQASTQRIKLAQVALNLQKLSVKNGTFTFNEPLLRLKSDSLIFDVPTMTLSAPNATYASTSLSAHADKLHVVASRDLVASGSLQFQGDLAKIERSMSLQSNYHAEGQIAGNWVLKQEGQSIAIQGSTNVTKPRLLTWVDRSANATRNQQNTQPWTTVWYEPEIKTVFDGTYLADKDELQITSLTLDSESIRLTASGTVESASTQMMADLTGSTEYDLAKLTSRFHDYLGDDVRLVGKVSRPFVVRGPLLAQVGHQNDTSLRPVSMKAQSPLGSTALVPSQLSAQAGVGWTEAHVYGLDIGENSMNAKLDQQRLHLPLDMNVGDGKLSLLSQIDLSRSDMLLVAQPGRVLDRINLSPELCGSWLKYIAPLVANSAEAQGTFSVDLTNASVPLLATSNANIDGILEIQQARVGPGSLARQFIEVAQQIKNLAEGGNASRVLDPQRPWMILPEQQVAFGMQQGRIAHRGLTMQISDVAVQTSGWVSLDEQLAMTASIPIRDEWLEGQRLLGGLRGRSLEVPIRGSFSRPQLDKRAIAGLAQQAVTGAAEGLIKKELGNQLERLFRKN